MIRRREFIAGLGGAAAWPLVARAQQALPVIGFLHSGDPGADADLAAAFRNGLREAGYIERQNVAIEYRWARNDNSRIPSLIDDLVRRLARLTFSFRRSITASRLPDFDHLNYF